MSYNFTVREKNKKDAKQAIADNFKNVVDSQTPHEIDRAAAVACGQAFVDFLLDPAEDEEILLTMTGSLGWQGPMEEKKINSAAVSVSAIIRKLP